MGVNSNGRLQLVLQSFLGNGANQIGAGLNLTK